VSLNTGITDATKGDGTSGRQALASGRHRLLFLADTTFPAVYRAQTIQRIALAATTDHICNSFSPENPKTPTASPRAQAQSRDRAATKQPDGQITQTLSSPPAKNIPLNIEAKSPAYLGPSHPNEGRLAIVTDVAVRCGGRGRAFDERRVMRTAKSCGPDAPTLASSS